MPLKKRTPFGLAGLAMALFVCSPRASAQDPNAPAAPQQPAAAPPEITAVPNRPTFSTTAELVKPGIFEIEYGFEAAKGHQNINGLSKFGLFKNLELWFLNNPVERDNGLAGMGDSGAGIKWRIVPQKRLRPTLGVLYVATLPTAKDELGAGAVGHSMQFLASKDFRKHHFDFNEGVQLVGRRGPGGFDHNYFTALAYSYQFTQKWGMTEEVASFSRTNAATPATLTLMAAATCNVSSRLVLDAGAYAAPAGNLPRVTFFAGVTYSIADLYHLHSERKSARR